MFEEIYEMRMNYKNKMIICTDPHSSYIPRGKNMAQGYFIVRVTGRIETQILDPVGISLLKEPQALCNKLNPASRQRPAGKRAGSDQDVIVFKQQPGTNAMQAGPKGVSQERN